MGTTSFARLGDAPEHEKPLGSYAGPPPVPVLLLVVLLVVLVVTPPAPPALLDDVVALVPPEPSVVAVPPPPQPITTSTPRAASQAERIEVMAPALARGARPVERRRRASSACV